MTPTSPSFPAQVGPVTGTASAAASQPAAAPQPAAPANGPAPLQDAPQALGNDWFALPAWLPVGDLGTLAVNAFLVRGDEPVLVDTGPALMAEPFMAALSAAIDPAEIRWIWLSHTDADHIGNLGRILEIAPQAQVVTSMLGAAKIGLLAAADPARLHVLGPDDVFTAGTRRFHQVKPAYYDAPEAMGFFESRDRMLFTVDSFGALLPTVIREVEAMTEATLREGMIAWSCIDAPWLGQVDGAAFGATLNALAALEPAAVLSGHLPVTRDLARLTGIIAGAWGAGGSNAVPQAAAAQVRALLEAA